jgi:hypothetical protein
LPPDIFKAWVDQLEGGGSSHLDAAELIHHCNILGGTEDVETATHRHLPLPQRRRRNRRRKPRLPKKSLRKSSRKPSPRPRSYPSPAPPPVRIGDVEVAPTLYNLYVDETREHIATLQSTART